MAASISDLFNEPTTTTRPNPATTTAVKTNGASSVTVDSTDGWATATAVHFTMYEVDADNEKVANTQVDYKGIVNSSTTINNLTVTAGTDREFPIGSKVICAPTAAWGDDLVEGLLVSHDQDGTLKAGAVDVAAVVADGILTEAKMTNGFLHGSDGWIDSTQAWTYVSATTFKITGTDVTSQFPVGTKLKLTQTTAKYFYVTAATFSTDTTITVTGGSDYSLANAAITSPMYSYMATPQGFPQYFNFTPSWTNLTTGNGTLNYARFSMRGTRLDLRVKFTFGSTSSISGNVSFATPVALSSNYGSTDTVLGMALIVDASATKYVAVASPNSTTGIFIFSQSVSGSLIIRNALSSTVPMTWTTSDAIDLTCEYEVA